MKSGDGDEQNGNLHLCKHGIEKFQKQNFADRWEILASHSYVSIKDDNPILQSNFMAHFKPNETYPFADQRAHGYDPGKRFLKTTFDCVYNVPFSDEYVLITHSRSNDSKYRNVSIIYSNSDNEYQWFDLFRIYKINN